MIVCATSSHDFFLQGREVLSESRMRELHVRLAHGISPSLQSVRVPFMNVLNNARLFFSPS
jgi:hypothetical protein